MKNILLYLLFILFFCSCKQEIKTIADVHFIDSLITHYNPSAAAKANEEEIVFWKKRMDAQPNGFTNEQKYASALYRRFHFFGDINDIHKADSIVSVINNELKGSDPGPNFSLATYAMAEHRFKDAYGYVQHLKQLGSQKYTVSLMSFDVDFETGNYYDPSSKFNAADRNNEYGYYFRLSKYLHLKGSLDESIAAMQKAAALGISNDYLEQASLSNEADLYIHAGQLQKAYDLYSKCARINACDFHSIMGMGWIALIHDNNNALASRIFEFVHTKIKSPEPLFRLYQAAQQRNDSIAEIQYAKAFAAQARDSVYGTMYNKYLIELYTGILNDPATAELLAENELNNRATPQTYAWKVWALFCNHKKEEAYDLYRRTVSGKPLEGLELYYMGKMMKGLNKGYNAAAFFEAAYKNRYDLSPAMANDLEKMSL